MNFDTINWLAVVVAAISAFMVGGLWYSKILFANAWMRDSNLDMETISKGNKGKIFGFAFMFSLIMAANLGLFLSGPSTDLHRGIATGFHAGLFTFSAIAIHSLFELKSWRLIFINGGYSVVSLVIMGAILGAWR